MSRKKLNAIISIVFAIIYFGSAYFTFTSCRISVSNDFSNITGNQFEKIQNAVTNINDWFGNKDEFVADAVLGNLGYGYYPSAFAIYDNHGDIADVGKEYINCNFESIFIDDYLTDDVIKQIKKEFGKLSSCQLYKMQYNVVKGKKVPTVITLFDVNTKREVDIQLNKSNSKQYTVYANESIDYYSLDTKKDDVTYLYMSVADILNKDKKDFDIQRNLIKRLKEPLEDETIKNIVDESVCGGGGYSSETEEEYHSIFQINDDYYYLMCLVEIDKNHSTFVDMNFREKIISQSIMFLIAVIILLAGANILFTKNKRLNEARLAFTSAAAHELKTPIAVIQNQCECVLENVAPEKNQEYISSIYSESLRLNKLVATLLQYNRLAFAASISKQPYEVGKIVTVELEKYVSMADTRGLKITSMIENGDEIMLNEELTALVVDNFLSNAIKHSQGEIIVSAAPLKKGYRVAVFNSGNQIDSKYRDNLWDVFYRTDKARTQNDDNSTGMGLAICKQILELHHFKYGFENKENGVEFYFIAN